MLVAGQGGGRSFLPRFAILVAAAGLLWWVGGGGVLFLVVLVMTGAAIGVGIGEQWKGRPLAGGIIGGSVVFLALVAGSLFLASLIDQW